MSALGLVGESGRCPWRTASCVYLFVHKSPQDFTSCEFIFHEGALHSSIVDCSTFITLIHLYILLVSSDALCAHYV